MKKNFLKASLLVISLFALNAVSANAINNDLSTTSENISIEQQNFESVSPDKESSVLLEENNTQSLYDYGVEHNIIDPDKYTFDEFIQDDTNYFESMFNDYNSISGVQKISYKEWLVLNNYGLLADTKESLLKPKRETVSTASNKRDFCNTVKKGDILISSGNSVTGLVGHSAIMTTDNWVLEMPGGSISRWSDNNRQITKDKWFDEHASDWNTVYRCGSSDAALKAASWADRNYYNPNGGSVKTIHIDYLITTNFPSTNPSYCSKLVAQAFWFGTGSLPVLNNISNFELVVPTRLPTYFKDNYKLTNKGSF